MKMLRDEMISLAAGVGHAAAARAAEAGYPKDIASIDPHRWASFGEIVPFAGDDSGEAAVQALAAYACLYHDQCHGEQLFLKARELGIHAWDASWADDLTTTHRLPYVLFCSASQATYETLVKEVEVIEGPLSVQPGIVYVAMDASKFPPPPEQRENVLSQSEGSPEPGQQLDTVGVTAGETAPVLETDRLINPVMD